MLCKVTYVTNTRNPNYINVHCIDQTSGRVARCVSKPGVSVGDYVNVRHFKGSEGWSSWAFPVNEKGANGDGKPLDS